jgi:putative ABC transport system substrate-binding protein
VIAPSSQAGGLAAKAATQTTPVVFVVGNDPVALGLVDSLNHPGGNATGVHILNSEMTAKRLQLLHEMVPATTLIAQLIDPTNRGNAPELRELQDAVHVLGLRLLPLNASNQTEIEAAFSLLGQQRAGGLLVPGDPFFLSQRDQIVALAAHHAVPTIYPYSEYLTAGGLVSYGTDLFDAIRLAGVYAGRILKGEKPADLPVQQSTKVELVINMKTAKALGLTFPTALLVRADEVIE